MVARDSWSRLVIFYHRSLLFRIVPVTMDLTRRYTRRASRLFDPLPSLSPSVLSPLIHHPPLILFHYANIFLLRFACSMCAETNRAPEGAAAPQEAIPPPALPPGGPPLPALPPGAPPPGEVDPQRAALDNSQTHVQALVAVNASLSQQEAWMGLSNEQKLIYLHQTGYLPYFQVRVAGYPLVFS
jgi:hypothetical protein